MKTTLTRLIEVAMTMTAAILVAALPAAAAQTDLLAPSATDLTPTELISDAPSVSPTSVESEPVGFAWPLDPSSELERSKAHTSTSYEYRLVVSAAELKAGVELATHGSAAVVRLNPAASAMMSSAPAINPRSLVVTDPVGVEHRSGDGMETMADAEQLKAAGAPFAEGTSAFRLHTDLGSGLFKLAAPDLTADDTSYLIHVLDRNSNLGFALQAAAPSFLAGQTFTAAAFVAAGHQKTTVADIRGSVVSPSGARMPVTFSRLTGGGFSASLTLPAETVIDQGLWEISATLEGEADGIPVRRDVRTAFAAALATARIADASKSAIDSVDGVAIAVNVEVASASRYEVRGVLYGSDSEGQLRPAAIAHSAAWLGVGFSDLELTFPADLIAETGLVAPYELRDLQLLDQGRMGVLHIQDRALIID